MKSTEVHTWNLFPFLSFFFFFYFKPNSSFNIHRHTLEIGTSPRKQLNKLKFYVNFRETLWCTGSCAVTLHKIIFLCNRKYISVRHLTQPWVKVGLFYTGSIPST